MLCGAALFTAGLALVPPLMHQRGVAPLWTEVQSYAYAAAACFGAADSAFNTQAYALLGARYADRGTIAFTAFNFVQNIGERTNQLDNRCNLSSLFRPHLIFLLPLFTLSRLSGMAIGFWYQLYVPLHGINGSIVQLVVQSLALIVASVGFVACERAWHLRLRSAKLESIPLNKLATRA